MAGPLDLTGQNIEDTYQRLLQTDDGTTFYDGTGSLVTLPSANTSSLLTTASAILNTLTFTKGDGSQFNVTIDTGSGGGGGGVPGGLNTQIQFNSSSVFSGSSNLSFDYTNNNLLLTGSILMSGSSAITGVDYIDFDTTASIATNVGRLHWNDIDGTLELGLKGGVVSSEIGQGLVTRIVNKTVPNIDLLATNYQVVVVSGAQGQRLAAKLAQADNDANSAGTLGIVAENIAKNQEGFIITVGLLKNRDTTGALQGETWSDGDVLYLSPTTAGGITNIKPQAPQHTIIVGYVEYAHQNNGKIYVKIDNGYEIDELHNVRITTSSLTTGDLLVYSSSVWINTKQLTGSYGLTGSLSLGNPLALSLNTTIYTSSIPIGSHILYSFPTSSYDGFWFEYTARSGSNARAGQMMGIWSGSEVKYTEVTTTDFGNTSAISFMSTILAENMIISSSVLTDNWTIKGIIRSI